MKLPSPWLAFTVTFLATFILCAIFLTNFPNTPSWVPGTTPQQMFWSLVRMNAPMWAFMSLLVAGLGTGLDLLLHRVLRHTHKV